MFPLEIVSSVSTCPLEAFLMSAKTSKIVDFFIPLLNMSLQLSFCDIKSNIYIRNLLSVDKRTQTDVTTKRLGNFPLPFFGCHWKLPLCHKFTQLKGRMFNKPLTVFWWPINGQRWTFPEIHNCKKFRKRRLRKIARNDQTKG